MLTTVSNNQSGTTSNTKLKIILAIPTAETNTRWPIPVKPNARNAVSEGRREEESLPKLSNRDTRSIILADKSSYFMFGVIFTLLVMMEIGLVISMVECFCLVFMCV